MKSNSQDRNTSRTAWTIFAYPACIADAQGLPNDAESRRYFSELRRLGLAVEVWRHPEIPDTVYFGIPFELCERWAQAVRELERQGKFETAFAAKRAEELFREFGE